MWGIRKYFLAGRILVRYIYFRFIQRVYPTMQIAGGYRVRYLLNDRVYTILIKKKRGPPRILYVMDDRGEDVTETVLGYLGPNEDFHGGAVLRPLDMGIESGIQVSLRDGREIRIEADSVLEIK